MWQVIGALLVVATSASAARAQAARGYRFFLLNNPNGDLTVPVAVSSNGQLILSDPSLVTGLGGRTTPRYIYKRKTKRWSPIDLSIPGAPDAHVTTSGINNSGEVVGSYSSGALGQKGFIWRDGKIQRTISFPGASSTVAAGINDYGVVVGHYSTGLSSPHQHSFVWTRGVFHTFDFPRMPNCSGGGWFEMVYAYAVNGRGSILGTSGLICGLRGMNALYEMGRFTKLDTRNTVFMGLNSDNQVVGATYGGGSRGNFFEPHANLTTWRNGIVTNLNPSDLPPPYSRFLESAAIYGAGVDSNGQIVGWYNQNKQTGSKVPAAGGFVAVQMMIGSRPGSDR
jgi:uncharacterized membrane protein